MMILQILSYQTGLYDQRLQSYIIWGHFTPHDRFGGVASPWEVAADFNQFFLLFLDHCQNLQTMLFSISKHNFFHSTLLSSATQFEFCDVDIACLYYLICIKIQIHHKTYYFNVI